MYMSNSGLSPKLFGRGGANGAVPCGADLAAGVTCPKSFKLPAQLCSSPDDYYGYREIEFVVLDRKGRRATWLEAKLSDSDEINIRNIIQMKWKERDYGS